MNKFNLEILDHLNHGKVIKKIEVNKEILLNILPKILEELSYENEIIININIIKNE